MRDQLRDKGYDKEEEYFKRKDRELIDNIKKKKDQDEK